MERQTDIYYYISNETLAVWMASINVIYLPHTTGIQQSYSFIIHSTRVLYQHAIYIICSAAIRQ